MGLDIGIIKVTYLQRPSGHAYYFAWELAEEAAAHGYASGEGASWGPFSKTQVDQALHKFVSRHALTFSQQHHVRAWLDSLPWQGDLIELHFSW